MPSDFRRSTGVTLHFLLIVVRLGSCCLSQGCGQPNGQCFSPYSQYQTDYAVNNYLGSHVTAKAYSGGGKGAFISKALDLLCQDLRSCQWQNDDNDQLDWIHGEGNVDVEKLQLITGSYVMPGRDFFILSSLTRPANHSGLLVSDPISCQKEAGVLSLQMWRSRARLPSQEPDLDICIRTMESTALKHCQTVSPDLSNVVRASIPPTEHPFFIVIKGYGFENNLEGGLILIADIRYAASVENIANCDGDVETIVPLSSASADNGITHDYVDYHSATLPKVLNPEATVMLIDQDSELIETDFEPVRRLKEQNHDPHNGLVDGTTESDGHVLTRESCVVLKCTKLELSSDTFCGYLPVGSGASGAGLNGWQVVNITENVANRLTGVHVVPPTGDQNIIVASFPSRSGLRRTDANRFVLESPYFEFSPSDAVYVGFQRYVAVHGIELAICTDEEGSECFYHYPSLDQLHTSLMSRSWKLEKVRLPTGFNKLFFIAQSWKKDRQNAGQIGIADIQLYYDEGATEAVC